MKTLIKRDHLLSLIIGVTLLSCNQNKIKTEEKRKITIKIQRMDLIRDSRLFDFLFTNDSAQTSNYDFVSFWLSNEKIEKISTLEKSIQDNKDEFERTKIGYSLCSDASGNNQYKTISIYDGFNFLKQVLVILEHDTSKYKMMKTLQYVLERMEEDKNPAWPAPLRGYK